MEDSRIIELYWLRDESAIQVTSRKYGPYLFKIAYNVLTDTRELSIDRLLSPQSVPISAESLCRALFLSGFCSGSRRASGKRKLHYLRPLRHFRNERCKKGGACVQNRRLRDILHALLPVLRGTAGRGRSKRPEDLRLLLCACCKRTIP